MMYKIGEYIKIKKSEKNHWFYHRNMMEIIGIKKQYYSGDLYLVNYIWEDNNKILQSLVYQDIYCKNREKKFKRIINDTKK